MKDDIDARQQFKKYQERGAYHWKAIEGTFRERHLYTLARYAAVLEHCALGSGFTVCDFGCGDGALSFLLKKSSLEDISVVGIEPSASGRRLAKCALEERGVTIEILESSNEMASGVFDLVVCAEVIEHVTDPAGLLQELLRLLKPGGTCIVSTPVRLTEVPWDIEHVREFFPVELAALFSQFFDVTAQQFYLPVPRVALYNWSCNLLFGRRPFRFILNLIHVLTGKNFLLHGGQGERFWHTQVITGKKRA